MEANTNLKHSKVRLSHLRPKGRPLPGDILLFTHAIGYTKIIPWFTNSRYYHVAIYEGQGCVLEARPEGVVRRNIAAEPDNVFRIIPMPQQQCEPVLNYARSCLGYQYDAMSIALVTLHEIWPKFGLTYYNDKRLMCAEYVVRAWNKGGMDLFPGEPPEFIIPANFQRFLPLDSRDQELR